MVIPPGGVIGLACRGGVGTRASAMDDAEPLIQRLCDDHSQALMSWALGRVDDQRDAEEVLASGQTTDT